MFSTSEVCEHLKQSSAHSQTIHLIYGFEMCLKELNCMFYTSYNNFYPQIPYVGNITQYTQQKQKNGYEK